MIDGSAFHPIAGKRMPRLLRSGVIVVKQVKGSRDYSPLLMQLEDLLEEQRNGRGSRAFCVAYEQVSYHSGVYAAHKYGAQVGVIQLWCARRLLKCIGVPVQTVKRVLRCQASGKAKEKAMVAAAHKLGYAGVTDHNEADAIGIALGAMEWTPGKTES